MQRFRTICLLTGLCLLFINSDAEAQSRTFYQTPEEVLRANVERTGGEAAWRKVESMRWDANMVTPGMTEPMGKRISVYRYPGFRFVENTVETESENQRWTFVVTPERSWIEAPSGIETIPGEDLPSLYGAKEELVILDQSRFRPTRLETGNFNGASAYCVTIAINGQEMKRYYDRRNLRLVGVENEVGGRVVQTLYGDYRSVEFDLQLPFRFETVLPEDNTRQIYQITRIDINGRAAESLFLFPNR